MVCEYIGEVISHVSMEKRMKLYTEKKKHQHIYMMELQKGEVSYFIAPNVPPSQHRDSQYIDATRKGGIARFVNHSCNPNCEIQQWTVGTHLRMVVAAKRDIAVDEELTFNYNMGYLPYAN
jgi:histone-lysine N-methyltransferase SETD2